MNKNEITTEFMYALMPNNSRKNSITPSQICSTLTTSAIAMTCPNQACRSTGAPKKSQRIYEKLEKCSVEEIREYFKIHTIKLLKILKIYSRNRKFTLAIDSTKEGFYGKFKNAEDKLCLHAGSIVRESYYYYEFLTISIVGKSKFKYILDGLLLKCGDYIEDKVKDMVKFVKEFININIVLFDRGFGWGVIKVMQELNVKYMVFWKKQGEWYKTHFDTMLDGESKIISKSYNYSRHKTNHKIKSKFILIKQLEYETKKYNWIFATNKLHEKAKQYVQQYKCRWGIETIYRVTDKIRIYTTSTKEKIRYFLFMFTCLVYNIWKFFQSQIGPNFTLGNFKINTIIYLAKSGKIYPDDYDKFESIAKQTF